MRTALRDPRSTLYATLVLVAVGVVVLTYFGGLSALGSPGTDPAVAPTERTGLSAAGSVPGEPTQTHGPSATPTPEPIPLLPDGGTTIFHDDNVLVAYYGTAGTPALGVLGQGTPDQAHQALVAAAAAFALPSPATGRPREVVPVYELIVTVADGGPGVRGVYSHDIDPAQVRAFIDLAHRTHSYLLLDIQPGREAFTDVAQRWAWALADPWVGLALDPEWRMGPDQVPGRVFGQVGAAEVNATAAWLSLLVATHRLPQKLFVLHQFMARTIPDVTQVQPEPGLAEVQHVDGFGAPASKVQTMGLVAHPERFVMGFKLFYRQDTPLMSASEVLGLTPQIRFVSFQ